MLHLPTLLILSIVLVATLGVLQLWLWRQDRALVVLAIWGAAHLMAALALLLLAGRHVLPHRMSIDVANAMLISSYGLVWAGARGFGRRGLSIAGALAGAVAWLVLCQVPAFYVSLESRVVVVSGTIAAYDVLVAREFLRRGDTPVSPLRWAVAFMFAGHALIQVGRLVGAVTVGFDGSGFNLPIATWFALPAIGSLMLAMMSAILLVAVAKDDAQRAALATLAEARDTAEQANIAKSRFLARMSHELRTPLNGVLGMAQALTRDPALAAEQRERAVILEQSGRHLLAIVNDILDLARAETGQVELSPHPVRTREIVDRSVEMVAETASGKGVRLRADFAGDTPPWVMADPVRVRQVLVNLLGNAIRFTPPDGEVVLSVSPLSGKEGIRAMVRDTGPGVAPNIVPYLFQDIMMCPVRTGTTEGTGLGLAISASLVQAMAGRIWYEPGPDGVGSVFVVEIPLARAVPPRSVDRTPVPAVVPACRSDVRVLVVDDVAANRRLAEVLLRQAGVTVEAVADGPSALAALDRAPLPDVILLDVYMPGMDGLTVARAIRARPDPARRIPLIAVTADASTGQIRASREAGMDLYLAKPFDVRDLLATIARAVPAA
ncbi:MAG: response regulator, partial [Acetobacteraceae bacterium]